MKILFFAVFVIEVCLSHTPGEASGNQSKWLSSMTGVKEGLLRRLAHVVLFAALAVTAGLAWGWYGIGAVALWSLLDEVTKIPIPGRHFCLWPDVILNIIGCLLGTAIWLITKM